MVNSTTRRLLSPGKTRYPLYRWLGGPRGRSGSVRKISPSPGIFFLFSVLHLYYFFVLIVLAVPFILTVQHTQHKHPCPRRNSNPQSQQASGCRPTPQTARPLGSAGFDPRTFQPVASRYTDCTIPVPEFLNILHYLIC